MAQVRRCLKCGILYSERPAMSRRDSMTLICPGCGLAEALFDITANFIMREGTERDKKAFGYLIEAERAWLEEYVVVGS